MFNYSRLKALLEERGVKQKHIADVLGKEKSLLTDWKNGKSVPSDEQLTVIANLLNTTADYLTEKTDEKNKPISLSENELFIKELYKKLSVLSPEDIDYVTAMIDRLARDSDSK